MSSAAPTVKQNVPAPKWTQEKCEKAQKEARYINIDSKTVSKLLLTGALKKWSLEGGSFVYIPKYRIAGSMEAVVDGVKTTPVFSFLVSEVKLSEVDAARVIMEGIYSRESVCGSTQLPYNMENLSGPLAAQYKAECAKQDAMNVGKPHGKKGAVFTPASINQFAKTLKDGNTTVSQKQKSTKTKNAGDSSRTKPLIEKVLKLAGDKVYDVSSFPTKSGKSTNVPKSKNSKKFAVTLRILDPATKSTVLKTVISSNAESLKLALQQIYPGDDATVNSYLSMWNVQKSSLPPAPVKPVATSPGTIVVMPTVLPTIPLTNGHTVPSFASSGALSPIQSMSSLYKK
jgi:hypothetical protein